MTKIRLSSETMGKALSHSITFVVIIYGILLISPLPPVATVVRGFGWMLAVSFGFTSPLLFLMEGVKSDETRQPIPRSRWLPIVAMFLSALLVFNAAAPLHGGWRATVPSLVLAVIAAYFGFAKLLSERGTARCVTIATDDGDEFVLATPELVIRAWDGSAVPGALRGSVTTLCTRLRDYTEETLDELMPGARTGFGNNTGFDFYGSRQQLVALARSGDSIDLLTDPRFEFVDPAAPAGANHYRLTDAPRQ